MYVTRPLSSYKRCPETVSLPPSEGPNSGYLVLFDEESETTTCFGLCKDKYIKYLPFPQNKNLTVTYSTGVGENQRTDYDSVFFIPVLDEPLSSNRYYVIRRKGKHKGEASTNAKEEDMETFCCCTRIPDLKPRELDPLNIDQQVEIIHKKHRGFTAIAPDGFPPNFLRRKYWHIYMSTPRTFQLQEALGLNPSLRIQLPNFNFSLSNQSSQVLVVGKWYTPFMFVKEDEKLKHQLETSTFYEITLEQRWDKIYECDNIDNEKKNYNYNNKVLVDVFLNTMEVFVCGNKEGIWDVTDKVNKVIWFRSCDGKEVAIRLGLSLLIVERMVWEEERVGWMGGDSSYLRLELVGGDRNSARVERVDEFGEKGGWRKYGCFVLVERFVFKRMDGSIALSCDFKHLSKIRSKWE